MVEAYIHDPITGQSYPLEAARGQQASASALRAAAEARNGAAALGTGGTQQAGNSCHDHEHSCGSNGAYDTGGYEGVCSVDSEGRFITATEVWASADRSRLHYVLKLPKTVAGQRKQNFGFVGLQRVRFKCGRTMVVSYCLRCCDKPTLYDRMVEGCERFPENASWWEGPALCACGASLVRSLGGEAGLEDLMQPQQPDAAAAAAAEMESQMEARGLVVEIEGGGWAVRAGLGPSLKAGATWTRTAAARPAAGHLDVGTARVWKHRWHPRACHQRKRSGSSSRSSTARRGSAF